MAAGKAGVVIVGIAALAAVVTLNAGRVELDDEKRVSEWADAAGAVSVAAEIGLAILETVGVKGVSCDAAEAFSRIGLGASGAGGCAFELAG